MNEINKRFLSELFLEKHVNCHQEIYNKLFYSIWPCETFFKEFLSNTSTELRINYAKKIYGFYRAFDDIVMPEFTINNVISLQQHDLTDSEGYTPQDHVVHSINLYIVGIYLFFNFPLFNKKILSQDLSEKTICQKIKSFIKKWKMFSLNHDLGYFFEYKVKPGGKATKEVYDSLLQYKELYNDLIFEYVTRSVARTILTVSFVQRSTQTFQLDSCPRQWKTKETNSGESISVKDTHYISNALRNYTDAVLLKDIESEELFSHFFLALYNEDILVEILDSDGYTLGYIKRHGDSIKGLYIIIDSILDDGHILFSKDFDSLYEKIPHKCTLKYYIKDSGKAMYSHLPIDYAMLSGNFYEYLPYFIQTKLAMSTTVSQINDCYFEIYKWLSESNIHTLSLASDGQSFFNKGRIRCYDEALKEAFMSVLTKMISLDADDQKFDTRVYIQSLVKKLNEDNLICSLTDETDKNTAERYKIENGVPFDILKYYDQTYRQVKHAYLPQSPTKPDKRSLISALESVNFINLTGSGTVTPEFFKHPDCLFENNLYNQIKKLSENLNIDFKSLIDYSPDYTGGDHGLISAALIFQVVASAKYFTCLSDELTQLKLAWYGGTGYNTLHSANHTREYAEVIFAVLLHNVYTHSVSPNYGIRYTHNIDKDSFSYFCTFCDTFQKWHRDKQIDLSKLDLPISHFLGDDFDIMVTHDKIKLKCNMQDAKAMRNRLFDDDKFLPGIMHFMEVIEY